MYGTKVERLYQKQKAKGSYLWLFLCELLYNFGPQIGGISLGRWHKKVVDPMRFERTTFAFGGQFLAFAAFPSKQISFARCL